MIHLITTRFNLITNFILHFHSLFTERNQSSFSKDLKISSYILTRSELSLLLGHAWSFGGGVPDLSYI